MEEFINRVNVWDKCDQAQQSLSLSLSPPLQEIFSNGTRKCVGYPWYMAVMNQWWNFRIKARTRERNFPQCATWKLLKGNKCMWQNKKEARYYSLDETSSVDTITPHGLLSFTFLQPRNVNQRAPFRKTSAHHTSTTRHINYHTITQVAHDFKITWNF